MFASLKETVAPDSKPVPVMVTVVCAEPRALALGDVAFTVGLTIAAFTVNTPVPVPVPPSGFVIVTVCAPSVALAPTVTGTVSDVALTKVTAPRVMFASPNETVAPDTKPVPVIVTVVGPVPRFIALGDAEVTVGAASTVNTLAEPVPPSGFVTVTVCAPSVALAPTVTGTVSDVALTKVTAPRVMFASPNETVAPDSKPVPVMVTVVCAEPCPLALGDVEMTVGLTTAFTLMPVIEL
jgi:hypothetical protein